MFEHIKKTVVGDGPKIRKYGVAPQPTDYNPPNSGSEEPLGPHDKPPDGSYAIHTPTPGGSITTKYRVPATPEDKRIQDGLFQGGVIHTAHTPEQTEYNAETVQPDQEHTKPQKKSGRHQKNLFILFLVLGISSIAALQKIEPANSFNTTGYFLTNISLASTNVIFVLFVFITGFILGRQHK